MPLPRFIIWVFPIGLMTLGVGAVSGQTYPNKPIRIVTAEAGGNADYTARLIGQGISGSLGQQVIVENRGGANGIIAGETVARAPPDGYALLLYSSSHWLLPFMQSVPYDPVRDFSPITLAVSSPQVLIVHPSLPVKSVKELIALAKARPGELNYAVGATGSAGHLTVELLKAMTGVNMVPVRYKGSGPSLNAVLRGEVQLMFTSGFGAPPFIKAGKLRALAVSTAQPSPLYPGLPTVAASGLPGYELETTTGMFAPAKTPQPIINRLNQEIVRVLNLADMKEKLLNTGVNAVGSSPEEFAAKIKSDMAKLGKLIKDAGIKSD